MNRIKILFLLFALVFLSSCGSRRIASMGTSPVEDAAAASVIAKHYENEAEFETLQGKLRVQFQNESQNQTVTVSYRMKKDEVIWMSAQLMGFPLAKVMITPNSVQFYEKITSTYFDGDFSLLSDLLGTPLDFQKVQNLLIGQTIYNMQEERYRLTESSRGYQLSPIQENGLQRNFLLDAGNYKAIAQQISQEGMARSVTVTYPSYQKVSGRVFPKEIKIIAIQGSDNTQIDMDFRSVEFDVPVTFPFSLPSGYEEIFVE